MKIIHSLIVVTAVGALLMTATGTARAEGDPIEAAKKEFEEAKAAFERGEYESSLEHFGNAQRIAPAPSLTYNIALVYERMGRFVDAANTFDKYLQELPEPTSRDEREFRDKLKARSKQNRQRGQQKPTAPPQPPPQQPPPQTNPQQPPQQQPYPAQPQPYPQQPYPQQPYPQQPYPQQPYGYPPGYGYTPYQPYGYGMAYPIPQKSPAEKITEARGRRSRAIALLAVGVTLNVAGIGGLAYGITAFNGSDQVGLKVGVSFVGFTFLVTGITLWAPGAASFVRSSKDIVSAQKEQQRIDEQKRNPGKTPTAYILDVASFSF